MFIDYVTGVLQHRLSPIAPSPVPSGVNETSSYGMATAATQDQPEGTEGELVWQYWDLLFLSEGVFALANIFSFIRLITLATLSQHIGLFLFLNRCPNVQKAFRKFLELYCRTKNFLKFIKFGRCEAFFGSRD